jgi:hypothetical protein
LQVSCGSQRLASGIEDRQRLVTTELDERATGRFDRLTCELGKPGRQACSGLVAALAREPRIPAHVGDQERLDPGLDSRHARIVRFGACQIKRRWNRRRPTRYTRAAGRLRRKEGRDVSNIISAVALLPTGPAAAR